MVVAEKTITVPAYAKINLCLYVLNKRDDGYHNIKSVMQMVDFGDMVTVTHTNETGIRIETNSMAIPKDDTNIAYRAARLMQECYDLAGGFTIKIDKRIPVAAGLAGGSTNAAAVMHAINSLCALGLTEKQLAEKGGNLGADVPFCIYAKPALAEGIGERLTPIIGLRDCYVVLTNPGIGVSTADIYRALDEEERTKEISVDALLQALSENAMQKAFMHMKNEMQQVVEQRCPAICRLLAGLKEAGAVHVMMSGSGATCFGIFLQEPNEEKLREKFGNAYIAIAKPITG